MGWSIRYQLLEYIFFPNQFLGDVLSSESEGPQKKSGEPRCRRTRRHGAAYIALVLELQRGKSGDKNGRLRHRPLLVGDEKHWCPNDDNAKTRTGQDPCSSLIPTRTAARSHGW